MNFLSRYKKGGSRMRGVKYILCLVNMTKNNLKNFENFELERDKMQNPGHKTRDFCVVVVYIKLTPGRGKLRCRVRIHRDRRGLFRLRVRRGVSRGRGVV